MRIDRLKFSFSYSSTWTFLNIEKQRKIVLVPVSKTRSYLFKTFVKQTYFGFSKFRKSYDFFETFWYLSNCHRREEYQIIIRFYYIKITFISFCDFFLVNKEIFFVDKQAILLFPCNYMREENTDEKYCHLSNKYLSLYSKKKSSKVQYDHLRSNGSIERLLKKLYNNEIN